MIKSISKQMAVVIVLSSLLPAISAFQQQTAKRKPVIIELFTSEGCSSCPPADLLLGKIAHEAEVNNKPVYCLAFHVDYWNRLGWVDSFSNKDYSQRQKGYEVPLHTTGVYTPQMVVNGTDEFVGSDESALRIAIQKESAKYVTAEFKSLHAVYEKGKIKVDFRLAGETKDYQIQLALVEKRVKTAVKRGENAGKVLEHTNVVRQFVTTEAIGAGVIEINVERAPDKDNNEIIAFIQNKRTMVIGDATTAAIELR